MADATVPGARCRTTGRVAPGGRPGTGGDDKLRTDGFAPIEDYAVLGDGRTVALLAVDGRVDWWPLPTLDAPPVCAALFDPDRGGVIVVAPEGESAARRRYVEGTNVVATTYTTATGTVEVTAALNRGVNVLPWSELVFRVEATDGHVPDAVARNGPEIHVFYTLGGDRAQGEDELPIAGSRHSRPVRSGNAASRQTQLGVYGDLFDTVHRYCREGHVLDAATARMLADQADRCCDQWRRRDSGMWELVDVQHYTISKMGCWVALDRAVRLAGERQIPDDHAGRWHSEAQAIREWVHTRCWSAAKRSYTFHADTDTLDAATSLQRELAGAGA